MIAVVSHDAGGAEILSSWLRKCQLPYCLVLEGPSINIFQKKLGIVKIYSLKDAINSCDWILCGTSWQSDLERQAIILGKSAQKKVVVFLDHWVNYSERFRINDLMVYPDEIWVGDEYAKLLANKFFPIIKTTLISNPYFEDLKIELLKNKKLINYSNKCNILYVCEPIREHSMLSHGNELYWGYTEEQAILFFLNNVDAISNSIGNIYVRPHPSESIIKYGWVKTISSLVAETTSTKTLLEQIIEADVVVGCSSMAMVVALLAKKRVICSIPPGGKACELPHPQIEHLQLLVKNK